MNGKIVFRILSGLVLVCVIAGIAFFAFNLGLSQHLQLPANNSGSAPIPSYSMPYILHPFPFFGFGCFAPLVALLLVFLALRAFSFLFWGPHWGHAGHMHHGWRRSPWVEGDVPPMFKEWHKRAHGEPDSDKKE